MKKVGILVGREQTFPTALIESINARGQGETVAEFIKLGGVQMDEERRYDLIIDRISHEIPFYRGFLKRAALEGTTIINNPFWWSADDKFFNFSLAIKLGVAIPRTVLLPQKDYIPGVSSESLRNLEFPLDWQGIVDYVGLPAILKPFDGGGWKNVSRVNSLHELWHTYDQTGTLCMTLQEFINFDQFVRCYCIGQEEVMIMPYDPRKAYLSGEQYINDPNYLTPELAERIINDCRTLCHALGYDINTLEFAIKDGIPYAIDFMNPAPDADAHSVGEFYHNWVVRAVTDLVFRKLEQPQEAPRYRWDALLRGDERQAAPTRAAAAAAGEQTTRNIPASAREAVAEIAGGVGDLVSEAVGAVSDVVGAAVGTETDKPARKTAATAKRSAATRSGATKKPATRSKKKPVSSGPDTAD